MAQLKIPSVGVFTMSQKHTLMHSRHTGVCFFAVTWDQLPSGPQSDSEEVQTEPPPCVPVGPYDQDAVLPDLT